MLAIVLRNEGFDSRICPTGDHAMRDFRDYRPDLVLLDLMLPGKDGIDVCKEIRAESGVPIVMLTAKNDTIDIVVGLESGADDYVVGARLEPHDDVDGVVLGREHDDGYAGLGPDLLADVDAVLAGQHQVEQNEVGPVVPKVTHGMVAGGADPRVEPLVAQDDRQHLRERRVVVYDEHLAAAVLLSLIHISE